jgi:hypothetical protein
VNFLNNKKLSHNDLKNATFPLIAYDTKYISDENDDFVSGKVTEVQITSYGIPPRSGATTPSISVVYPDRRQARTSVDMFYAHASGAQAEIDEAAIYAKENPPYETLKKQRNDAVSAISDVISCLDGIKNAKTVDVGVFMSFISEKLEAIQNISKEGPIKETTSLRQKP